MTELNHNQMLDSHCKMAFNIGIKTRKARNQNDEARAKFHSDHFQKIKSLYTNKEEKDRLQVNFNLGYKEG